MSHTHELHECFNPTWDDWRLGAAEALVVKDVHRLSQELQRAENALSAIRLEQEKRRLRAEGISLKETIGLVRKVQADLDRFGELSLGTLEDFSTVIQALDGAMTALPPDDQPF